MKNICSLLLLLLLLIDCDKASDKPIPPNATLIEGKWKQNEAYISAGGPQYWIDVDNGEEIEFYNNGTFSSNRFTECTTGTFSLEENKLSLEYDCDGFETQSENGDGFITYDLELFSNHFILTPTSGPICIEGCSYKYQSENN